MNLFKSDGALGKSSTKKLAIRFPFTGLPIPYTRKKIEKYALGAPGCAGTSRTSQGILGQRGGS